MPIRLVSVAAVALVVGLVEAGANETCTGPLSLAEINPLVVKAQYAVRGRLLNRAMELEKELKAGKELPFKKIVRCNIGNPI